MKILSYYKILKFKEFKYFYKQKENLRLAFLTMAILLAAIACTSTILLVISNKIKVKESEYPFILNYMSSSYNYMNDEQVKSIEGTLDEYGYKYKKIDYKLLNINNEGKYVIKNSEFNKLAKELNLDTVDLGVNETLIVPRFDNERYKNKISEFKDFDIGLYNLNVEGIATGQILPKGVGTWVVVVNDKIYSQLEKDLGNTTVNVTGYDYNNWEDSTKVDEIIQNKLKSTSINNYEKRQEYDSFFSLPKLYENNSKINNNIIFIDVFVSIVCIIISMSFLYYKFYKSLSTQKIKDDKDIETPKLSFNV